MLTELITDRLSLRPSTVADVSELLTIWNDRGVNRHLFDGKPLTREDVERLLKAIEVDGAPGIGSWSVRWRGAPEIIGSAALMRVSYAAELEPRLRGLCEPAIALRESLWGRGLGTEILHRLIAHAFDVAALGEIAAAVDLGNVTSQRLVRAAGFQELSRVDGVLGPVTTFLLRRPEPAGAASQPAHDHRPLH